MKLHKQIFAKLKKEFVSHKIAYLILLLLLIAACVLRFWRIDQLLNFQYDQGRDAIQIAQMIQGKLTLIGPTTGIEGIFLGPFYYYFLLPGYLLGAGDPVIASYWQSFWVVAGFLVIFIFMRQFFSIKAALFSVFLISVSYFQAVEDRWLSNPTPTILFSPLTLLLLTKSFKKPIPYLFLAGLMLGINLQLEASSGFFFLVSTIIFMLLYRKSFGFRAILTAVIGFLITLLPQLLFELRHQFLLTHNLLGFLLTKGVGNIHTFSLPTIEVLVTRMKLLEAFFLEKLWIDLNQDWYLLTVVAALIFAFITYKLWSNNAIKVMAFWFFGTILFYLFYQGNQGRVYGYYFTPLLPIFYIYLGIILSYFWKIRFAKIAVVVLLLVFFYDQWGRYNYFSSGLDGQETIAYGNQKAAVLYVLQNGKNEQFNTDVYVPPIIAYPYMYLFSYLGQKTNVYPVSQLVPILYTIHEFDSEMPSREQTWLKRQDGIGKIEFGTRFGGVQVEKRSRNAS